MAGVVVSSALNVTEGTAAPQAACKPSWEIVPAPIPAGEIKETVTTEVVVIGAGVAGITTALSAAEGGAKVIVLEKGKTFSVRGFDSPPS
jgi:fumarate reductase flavoprotein subunit